MTTSLTLTTSTTFGSLVLSQGKQIIKELSWQKEKSHSEKITTELLDLFEGSGLSFKDLHLIICTKGPGSFTGIRVGLSVVKTLSYAYNIPVAALNDGQSIALNALGSTSSLPILVLLDAQKNKVFHAIYKNENGLLKEESPPQLIDLNDVDKSLSQKQYLCLGDGYARFKDLFEPPLLKKLSRDDRISDVPQARIISQYVNENEGDFPKISWNKVEPLYLRVSSAEEVLAQKMGLPN